MQQHPPPPPPNQPGQQNQPIHDPQANAQGGQTNTNEPLNPAVTPYTGWYPRWWLLAAFCYSIVFVLVKALWQPVICRNDSLPLCGFVGGASFWIILPMLLFFLLLWYGIFVICVVPVEIPRGGGSRFGDFVRNVSRFNSLRTIIIGQGIIAFILLNVLWWTNRTTPIAFTMLVILVFVGHCCFVHPLEIDLRRLSLLVYGMISLVLLALEMTLRPHFFTQLPPGDEWPLLLAQLVLCMVSIITLIVIIRTRPAPAQTAIDAQNQNINNFIRPGAVWCSVWPLSRIFPVRPVPHANQQANQNPPNQPDPQAPQNNQRPQGN